MPAGYDTASMSCPQDGALNPSQRLGDPTLDSRCRVDKLLCVDAPTDNHTALAADWLLGYARNNTCFRNHDQANVSIFSDAFATVAQAMGGVKEVL